MDQEFLDRLKTIAAQDTSADPERWTTENPLWGHCTVASLLAQDIFGGELMRGSLKQHPKYAYLRSHFWNRLPDGTEVDFTAEQYPDLTFRELVSESREREIALESPDTQRRYGLLRERYEKSSGIKTS